MPRTGPQPGAARPRAYCYHMTANLLTRTAFALAVFGLAVAQTPSPTPAAATPTAAAANSNDTNEATTVKPLTNYTAQILGQNLTVFAQSVRIPNALFASRACQVRQRFHLRCLSDCPVDSRGRVQRVGAAWREPSHLGASPARPVPPTNPFPSTSSTPTPGLGHLPGQSGLVPSRPQSHLRAWHPGDWGQLLAAEPSPGLLRLRGRVPGASLPQPRAPLVKRRAMGSRRGAADCIPGGSQRSGWPKQ